MDIKTQFNLVAEEYDANRRKFIPCFDDYYEGTAAFVERAITSMNSCMASFGFFA